MRSVVHIFNVSHKIYISVCLTLSVIRLVDSGNAYFLYVIGRESFGSYIKIIQFIETERRTHTSISKVIIATNNDLSTARYQNISSFISDTLLLSKKVSEIWIKIQHFYTCRYVSDHTKWILRCRLHNVGHSVSAQCVVGRKLQRITTFQRARYATAWPYILVRFITRFSWSNIPLNL